MSDSTKSLLHDGMKILHPDCPILLSNFVKKALNDKINLERNALIDYVQSQEGGDQILCYITLKRKGDDARDPRERKRAENEADGKTDGAPTPQQRQTRRKPSSSATSHQAINTEELDPDVASEENISELVRFAKMKVPNVLEFKAKAAKAMLDDASSDNDVIETFLYFQKKGLIKKIEFVPPPKAKQPIENITEEPPPSIEDNIFEAMEFKPGSKIDKLFKEAIAVKPERNGVSIVQSKLQMKARDKFDALVHNKNPMDLTTDDIKNLIPGCVSCYLVG